MAFFQRGGAAPRTLPGKRARESSKDLSLAFVVRVK